jgi:hypothetical protein
VSILESGAWKPAVKSAAKARIAIYGVGGSGKSLSALMIARGLVGEEGTIAVLDTEGGTASIYADRFDFSTIVMNAPFATTRFRDAVDNASAAGFDCLIVDGISPFWDGPGGVLELVDLGKKRGGGWADGTPAQQIMQQAISTCPIHIILTMRAKSDTVIEMVNGKATPRKVGMKYVQRDSIEYEVSWLFYADKDHSLTIDKQRGMEELDGITIGADTRQRPEPAEALGGRIRAWLSEGTTPAVTPVPPVVTSAPDPTHRSEPNRNGAPNTEGVAAEVTTPTTIPAQTEMCKALLKAMTKEQRAVVRECVEHLGIKWDAAVAFHLVKRFGVAATDVDVLLRVLAEAVSLPPEGTALGEIDTTRADAFQAHLDAEREQAAIENIAAVEARHAALAAAGGYGAES